MSIPIVITSINQKAVSETFIQAHRKYLNGNIHYVYNGHIPTMVNGKSLAGLVGYYFKLQKILPQFFYQKFINPTFNKNVFAAYLKKNKIRLVLAEYGTAGAEVAPICKSLNIPLIVHFHGYDASIYSEIKKYERRYRAMFEYSKYIISVSNCMTNRLKEMGCPAEKIAYNPYGPADTFFDLQADISNGYFLAVGRFVEKKAPMLTILAFARLQKMRPAAKMVMIGNGPLLGACRWLAESLQCEIDFKTDLPHEEVISFFSEAAFFVQHSVVAYDGDREGTPVGILEACAAGLCVLSTRHEGIADVIADGETGFLVDEGDVEGMFNYMQAAFDSRELAAAIGQKARERVRQHFTMQKHIDTLNELVKCAAGAPF